MCVVLQKQVEEAPSKLNGLMKTESQEEERREMITPALREALTKQGTAPCVQCEKKIQTWFTIITELRQITRITVSLLK